jgi:hypothetical protein
MAGSYDRRPTRVRITGLVLVLCALSAWPGPSRVEAQSQSQDAPSGKVRLQLRIFEGGEDITREARLQLYPRGQRTNEIATTLGADQAYETDVEPGFYDVQLIKERRGQVLGVRWVEQILVQRYPDEYGRHLQVLNLNPEFGALQIRPAPGETAGARGWSAVALAPGETTREVSKARPIGDDLLIVLPAGRYDIRVNLGDRSTTWLREVDIPGDRTRLKTWSAKAATP